jgi:uncharacterized protein (DUF1330 family)
LVRHDFGGLLPAPSDLCLEESSAMAAYLIADIASIHDTATYDEYRKHTPDVIQQYGGRFIVRGGRTDGLEGGWNAGRIVVIEFPDMATARRFYDSPEYQKILPLRLKASNGRAILVEGV